jgi:hypothetical protein
MPLQYSSPIDARGVTANVVDGDQFNVTIDQRQVIGLQRWYSLL